jgi:hypothetical protein
MESDTKKKIATEITEEDIKAASKKDFFLCELCVLGGKKLIIGGGDEDDQDQRP